jgi:hypothetical protein
VSPYSEFASLHARDIQSILRQRLILVHGVPIDYNYGWDLESMSRLYDVDKKTHIHGEIDVIFVKYVCLKFDSVLSKGDAHDPEPRYHQGTLRDLYNLTQTLPEDECPPLNAISLPAYYGNVYTPPQFRSFSTHEVAQNRLPTHYSSAFDVPNIKKQLEWSLIGSKGAVSPLHVDSEGFGTAIVVLEGSKYWIVATRLADGEMISSVDSLGSKWNPYFINDGDNSLRFRFEGVHLQKGDML